MLGAMQYVPAGSAPTALPTPEQMDRWTRRCSPPDNEVPHGVPASVLLARTDTLAIAITGMSVYTTGVSIEVAVRLRDTPPGVNSRDLHQMLGGHRFPDDSGPDRRLLLGVEFSDGRTADNIDGRPLPATINNNDEIPLLSPNRGSGGEGRHDQTYWLSPVPPDGPLVVVCAWPALGIAETPHVLAQPDLTTASAHALVLWPRTLRSQRSTQPPPPPQMPEGSWFTTAAHKPKTNPGESF